MQHVFLRSIGGAGQDEVAKLVIGPEGKVEAQNEAAERVLQGSSEVWIDRAGVFRCSTPAVGDLRKPSGAWALAMIPWT